MNRPEGTAPLPQPESWWSLVLRRLLLTVACAVVVVAAVGLLYVVRVQAPPLPDGGAPASAPIPIGGAATGAGGAGTEAGPPLPQATVQTASAVLGVDHAWAENVARVTGIPARAVVAYAAAELTLREEEPSCGIGWNTLAGIGRIESDHGRHGGAVLGASGYSDPAIRGIPLTGDGTAEITDTDDGAWDGDTVWDRAVGPLQFIPDTWKRWGADADGDGRADPNQIDDAALAAARYLCAAGPMTTAQDWRAAIFSYNHLDSYVDDVAAVANDYARKASG